MVFKNVNLGDRILLVVSFPLSVVESVVSFNRHYTYPVIRLVRNWWDVGFVYFGFSEEKIIHLNNGESILVTKQKINDLVSKMRSIQISKSTKNKFDIKIKGEYAEISADGNRIKVGLDSLISIVAEFESEPHKDIDVEGKVVIDAGAYLSETAVYYAVIGKAKHVYSFEPFPFLFKKCVENIKLNKLEKRITMLNEAVSGSSGTITMDEEDSSFGLVGNESKGTGKTKIKSVSLNDLVKNYRIQDGVLKLDCEGAEYDIINSSSDQTLRAFEAIQIEYHYGYKNLKEKLEHNGFKVSYTRPKYNFKGVGKEGMLNGDIFAFRISPNKS